MIKKKQEQVCQLKDHVNLDSELKFSQSPEFVEFHASDFAYKHVFWYYFSPGELQGVWKVLREQNVHIKSKITLCFYFDEISKMLILEQKKLFFDFAYKIRRYWYNFDPRALKNEKSWRKTQGVLFFFIQVRSKFRRMSRSSKEKLTCPSASPHLLLTYLSYSGRGT